MLPYMVPRQTKNIYEAIYCAGDTLTIDHNTLLNPHDQTAVIFWRFKCCLR